MKAAESNETDLTYLPKLLSHCTNSGDLAAGFSVDDFSVSHHHEVTNTLEVFLKPRLERIKKQVHIEETRMH